MTRPPSVKHALDAALRSVPVGPEDGAAVALAKGYAVEIDADRGELARLGPLLLATLSALRMTPAARSLVVRGGVPGERASRSDLDRARERRGTRADRAAAVDASAP